MTKLLKYELKQTWRMGITLVSTTLLGCLGLVLNPFSVISAISQIYIGVFVIITMASPLALFLFSMASFNRDFTRPQGYLMMTLPIKAKDFILAKFTSQLMWNILCFIILAGSVPFVISRYELLDFIIQSEFNVVEAIVFFTSGFIFHSLGALIIYFSIVVLSMEPGNNHSTFMKVILAIILINITNVLTNTVSVLIPMVSKGGFAQKRLVTLQFSGYIQNNAQEVNVYSIIINALMIVIFYLMTKKIIEQKVQL